MQPRIDVAVLEEGQKMKPVLHHHRLAIGSAANLAMSLMNMSMANPTLPLETAMGGTVMSPEGHQFTRAMTPKEIVDRAVEIAALAFVAFEARGWTTEVPSIDEIKNDPPSSAGFAPNATPGPGYDEFNPVDGARGRSCTGR